MRHALLALLLLASPAWADGSGAQLPRAVSAFENGDLGRARDLLLPLVETGVLAQADHTRARMFLAATYHALGDDPTARAQLRMLVREDPRARLDPGVFVPELIALAEQARIDVDTEPLLEGARPGPNPPAMGWSLVPFGVGQFANGEPGKGWFFAASEAVALGSFAVGLAVFEGQKRPGGVFLASGQFDDPRWALALNRFYVGAFYAWAVLTAAGVVDAVISRPAPTARVQLTVTPNGLAVRF